MNKQLFTFLSLVLLFFCLVCNRSPSQPEEKINNPRNYTWTVDTLAYPGSFQTQMRCIWGSSAKDVYVVGHNDGGSGKMYRYTGDGMWHHINLPKIGHWFDLSAVYGFAENDVWTVGYSRELITRDSTGRGVYENRSLIFHYDGVQWNEVDLPEWGNMLESIWGSAPDDIWAGGINGTLFHYNGSFWEKDSLPKPIPETHVFFYNMVSITGNFDITYLLQHAPFDNSGSRYYFYKNSYNSWTLIDSTLYTTRRGIWLSPNDELYTIGSGGVYRRNNSYWENILGNFKALGINGTENDIFVVGYSGLINEKIYHFNGTDWWQYENISIQGAELLDIWTDGREVFIVGYLGNNSIILHGK
ncbi:hypothetical protein GF337_02485 [candidate division KSB1 bacterium]|nr:hypothetical protein [candidate division KSB1 bacterium]